MERLHGSLPYVALQHSNSVHILFLPILAFPIFLCSSPAIRSMKMSSIACVCECLVVVIRWIRNKLFTLPRRMFLRLSYYLYLFVWLCCYSTFCRPLLSSNVIHWISIETTKKPRFRVCFNICMALRDGFVCTWATTTIHIGKKAPTLHVFCTILNYLWPCNYGIFFSVNSIFTTLRPSYFVHYCLYGHNRLSSYKSGLGRKRVITRRIRVRFIWVVVIWIDSFWQFEESQLKQSGSKTVPPGNISKEKLYCFRFSFF